MRREFELVGRPPALRNPSLRELAAVFFRYRKLFLITFVLVLLCGVFYAIWGASYAAQMKLMVRHGRIDPVVSPTPTMAPAITAALTEEELNSAVELLRDDDLLHEVVAKTGLVKPTSWRSTLLRQSTQQRTEAAVHALSKALDVKPLRKSQLIAVLYHSSDPQLSANVLTSLGEQYLIRQRALQRPPEQSNFFDQQVHIASREVQAAQSDLEDFIRTNRVGSATLERDLALQKLSEAQASDFALQASVAEAERKVQLLDEKLQQMPARRVSQVRTSDNPQLQERLKSKLLELELRRTQLLTKFQPSYRLVQEIDQQIAQTRTTLEAENLTPVRDELTEDNPDYAWATSERVKIAVEMQGLRSRKTVSQEQLESLGVRVQQLAKNTIEQSDLEQKLKIAKDKYQLYLTKREEARIGDQLDLAGILNVAIVQPPRVPALPETPLAIVVIGALFAACALSTGAVFAANFLDPSLRTPSELADLLGLPVLAALPGPPATLKLRAL